MLQIRNQRLSGKKWLGWGPRPASGRNSILTQATTARCPPSSLMIMEVRLLASGSSPLLHGSSRTLDLDSGAKNSALGARSSGSTLTPLGDLGEDPPPSLFALRVGEMKDSNPPAKPLPVSISCRNGFHFVTSTLLNSLNNMESHSFAKNINKVKPCGGKRDSFAPGSLYLTSLPRDNHHVLFGGISFSICFHFIYIHMCV